MTPSVVNFRRNGEVDLGTPARRVMVDEPESTIAYFKRYMGKEKKWTIFNKEHTPTELSRRILEHIKCDALEELRKSDPRAAITKAVITVPAAFSKSARSATIKAAVKAGITVDRLLDEPTAAILYHQHCYQRESDVNGYHAVVDIGGGTLDISIVRVDGVQFRVIGSSGSNEIGGIDFDRAMLELLKTKFREQSGGANLDQHGYGLHYAEEIKKILSDKTSHRCRISGIDPLTQRTVRQSITVTRTDFEVKINPLIESIGEQCISAMIRCRVSPEHIREVLLVGGSARVPAVKNMVDDVFEKVSLISRKCDEAVARGAGIYAASQSLNDSEIPFNEQQRQSISEINLTEVLHKYYGVISKDSSGREMNSFLLKPGTKIPCTERRDYYLDDQEPTALKTRTVKWKIIESDDDDVDPISGSSRTIQIETLTIETDVPNQWPGKNPQLEAVFRCDANKVLHCEFIDRLSGAMSVSNVSLREE